MTASGAALNGNRTTIPERSTTSAIGSATTRSGHERRRRRTARRLARLGGQDSPPAVEVRPGELPIAAKRIDRLTGLLPGVDQCLARFGLARDCVVDMKEFSPPRKTHRLPDDARRHHRTVTMDLFGPGAPGHLEGVPTGAAAVTNPVLVAPRPLPGARRLPPRLKLGQLGQPGQPGHGHRFHEFFRHFRSDAAAPVPGGGRETGAPDRGRAGGPAVGPGGDRPGLPTFARILGDRARGSRPTRTDPLIKSPKVGDSNPLPSRTSGEPTHSLAPDLAPELWHACFGSGIDVGRAVELAEVLRSWAAPPGPRATGRGHFDQSGPFTRSAADQSDPTSPDRAKYRHR